MALKTGLQLGLPTGRKNVLNKIVSTAVSAVTAGQSAAAVDLISRVQAAVAQQEQGGSQAATSSSIAVTGRSAETTSAGMTGTTSTQTTPSTQTTNFENLPVDEFYQAMVSLAPVSPTAVYKYFPTLTVQGKHLSFNQQADLLQACINRLKKEGQTSSSLYEVMQKSLLVCGMLKTKGVELVNNLHKASNYGIERE